MQINIDKYQLSDICNVYYGVFYPLKKFVSKKEFISISKNKVIHKNVFFPLPIYFAINHKTHKKLKNNKKIDVYYKNNNVCSFKIKHVYSFNKKEKNKLGKNIYGTNDMSHPGFLRFIKEGPFYLDCEICNFQKKILRQIKFSNPKSFIAKLKKENVEKLASFHTRNVPHKGHEWIHKLGLKKCKHLLIQPLINQFRKGEYDEDILIRTNKYLANKVYKNTYFAYFNSYPRYAGPKEGLLHALVRKNYGCTHFLVGRDHAGVGKYYKKYATQQLCKKFQKTLGLKMISFNEPYLCKACKKVVNKKCDKCSLKNYKFKINGTYIRNLILNKKNIPELIMRKKISKMLGKKSIIT